MQKGFLNKRFCGLCADPIRGIADNAMGPQLYCLLDSGAPSTRQDFDIDDFAVVGGEQIFIQRLAERLPESEAPDKVGKVLDEIFIFRASRGERAFAVTGRLRIVFSEAAREGIKLPEVAKGHCLVWALGWNAGDQNERRAMLLTAANQGYRLTDLTMALTSLSPNRLPHDRHTCVAEPTPLEEPAKDILVQEMEPVMERSEITEELATETEVQEVLTNESIPEESESIAILVNWKKQRKALSKEKSARGCGQPRPDLNSLSLIHI